MDQYSGKRSASGLFVPRKGPNLVVRDKAYDKDEDIQFCNRIGCSGRLNHTKVTQSECSQSSKSRLSSRSTGKNVSGSLSGARSKTINSGKPLQGLVRKSVQRLADPLKTSSTKGVSRADKFVTSSSSTQSNFPSELGDARSGKVPLAAVGSPSTAPNAKSQKVPQHKTGPGSSNSMLGTSAVAPAKTVGQGLRNTSNGHRYGLRSLKCNSTSDVLPQATSTSESNCRRRDMIKRRNPEGESSSSKGKKSSGPASEDVHVSLLNTGISTSDSRHNRSWAPRKESGPAFRNRRTINANTGITISDRDSRNSLSLTEFVNNPQLRHNSPMSARMPMLSDQFPAEASSSDSNSSSMSFSNDDNLLDVMSFSSGELDTTRSVNRDALRRRYNMDGIAEVLLALERIEQDEELTYEQVLALETNLFVNGLNFHDQHRDMRLDIDNMTYEELLALEERMGTVSTAVSEDTLAKCLKKSVYQEASPGFGVSCDGDEYDIKCSICQEEYVIGDEVGKMECDHGYHVECIHQWLRLKNWCPICKASAAPSKASLSS